jgi:hypothetical protein
VLDALPDDSLGITEKQLGDLLDLDGRKFSRALRDAVEDGDVEREGLGRAGNPYYYFRASKAPPDGSDDDVSPGAGETCGGESPRSPYMSGADSPSPNGSSPPGGEGETLDDALADREHEVHCLVYEMGASLE